MRKILISFFYYSIFLWMALPFSFCYAQEQPLPPEKAFAFSVSMNSNQQLILAWEIAPHYYLYKQKIQITQTDSSAKLPAIIFPVSKNNHYYDNLKIILPLTSPKKNSLMRLHVRYQGCSEAGFCYAPIEKIVQLNFLTSQTEILPTVTEIETSKQEKIENILSHQNIFMVVISFLGLGLLLAFTPCVLPMIPILSGIIIGQQRKDSIFKFKGFSLSLAYVLGMALTYAGAGVAAAFIGSQIQTLLQQPWVIILFSLLFILLGLSLFGWRVIRLPVHWQRKINHWIHLHHARKGGTYLGVFAMGGFSCLVISPCISPALAGALAYITNTGDIILGGLALFALGIGMGLPLLLVGASAGKLLPKAGRWMVVVERLTGVMLFIFAIILLTRIIPSHNTLPLPFQIVKNQQVLSEFFKQAQKEKKWVLLDFWAKWCVSCGKMDKEIFSSPEVKNKLNSFILLRADITENNAFDKNLLKQFHVIAPPTVLFFLPNGVEVSRKRVIGDITEKEFLDHLKKSEDNVS